MLRFVRANLRPLAFGGLHAFYSAPGQTYVVGIFVAALGVEFGMDSAGIGALYLFATVGSAATLLFVGHWIDHIRLVYFSAFVVVGMAVACFVTAAAPGAFVLFVGFYLLRLTGQGLMVHVEATATARAFDKDRGRALGITALGIPLSEMVFPPLAVLGIAAIGWRPTYALFGAVALLVLLPLTQWLLSGVARGPRPPPSAESGLKRLFAGLAELLRSRYLWTVLPALGLLPFFGTAFMFHITTIAEIRDLPAGMVAWSFPILAVTNVIFLFVSGHYIDRISARRLFPLHALPLLAGFAVMALVQSWWALPIAMMGFGVSVGIAKPTFTAMWAEVFGTEKLGTIRSAISMYMVFMSALSPWVYGVLLDGGLGLSTILLLSVGIGLVLSVPAALAERRSS